MQEKIKELKDQRRITGTTFAAIQCLRLMMWFNFAFNFAIPFYLYCCSYCSSCWCCTFCSYLWYISGYVFFNHARATLRTLSLGSLLQIVETITLVHNCVDSLVSILSLFMALCSSVWIRAIALRILFWSLCRHRNLQGTDKWMHRQSSKSYRTESPHDSLNCDERNIDFVMGKQKCEAKDHASCNPRKLEVRNNLLDMVDPCVIAYASP